MGYKLQLLFVEYRGQQMDNYDNTQAMAITGTVVTMSLIHTGVLEIKLTIL